MEHKIGDIISRERQNRKMTQEEFASRLGVTPQAVSKWERGLGLPDLTLAEGICGVLHISADVLLSVSGDSALSEDIYPEALSEIGKNMFADPFVLEIGIGLVDPVEAGIKSGIIRERRKELAAETGILMPLLRIVDKDELGENEMRILIYDEVQYQEENLKVTEHTFEYLIGRTAAVCRENYHKILNKQMVKMMVDHLKDIHPFIADQIIPEKIDYLTVEFVLMEIVQRTGKIRNLIRILEGIEWEVLHEGIREPKIIAEHILETTA